ncbi:MAG: polysaccharide deacetylase family protein [Archangium sp.]
MAGNQERLRSLVRGAWKQVGGVDGLAYRAGERMPVIARKLLMKRALGGLSVSLCLHRVADTPRSTDWQPYLCMSSSAITRLTDDLLDAGARVTVTFDDGYRDAAEWLEQNAARFPQVEFLFFVCPEKAEQRAGFRWDLVETRGLAERADELMSPVPNVAIENTRSELRELASRPEFALSTVDELKALARSAKNVKLGNHTNLHLSPARFPDEVVREDFRRSTAAFERLFGTQQHFAFPFGTPQHHFTQKHVDWLQALGDFTIWTTEARPYRAAEVEGGVLPRFPVNGQKDPASLAGWIAARALDFRVRGSKFRYS